MGVWLTSFGDFLIKIFLSANKHKDDLSKIKIDFDTTIDTYSIISQCSISHSITGLTCSNMIDYLPYVSKHNAKFLEPEDRESLLKSLSIIRNL